MNGTSNELYGLVPAYYRQLDAERNGSLGQLLQIIDEQSQLLERDIYELYDNWFVETCEESLVPYLAKLVGYHSLVRPTPLDVADASISREWRRAFSPRRDVADTIRNRRRKGTLSVLEDLAADVTGWPARAVEFRRLLRRTHDTRRTHNLARDEHIDMNDDMAISEIGGAFESSGHSLDTRSPAVWPVTGAYRPNQVGVFVWPLQVWLVVRGAACPLKSDDPDVEWQAFSFDGLGRDTPLYCSAVAETDATHIAERQNVPRPLTVAEWLTNCKAHYGRHRDLYIELYDSDTDCTVKAIAPEDIMFVDSSRFDKLDIGTSTQWVAVDPARGRIKLLPRPKQGLLKQHSLLVSYRYACQFTFGGGTYLRNLYELPWAETYRIAHRVDAQFMSDAHQAIVFSSGSRTYTSIEHAIDAAFAQSAGSADSPREILIEITSNGAFELPESITIPEHTTLQIRAANEKRPILLVPEQFSFSGDESSRLVLDGLHFRIKNHNQELTQHVRKSFSALRIIYPLADVSIRHCTIVADLDRELKDELGCNWNVSLAILSRAVGRRVPRLTIDRSHIGRCAIEDLSVDEEPLVVRIRDCVLDTRGTASPVISNTRDWPNPNLEKTLDLALEFGAHIKLTVDRSTILGRVFVRELPLAETTIFDSPLAVLRQQEGCLRFCWVAPESRTPTRYRCVSPKNADDDLFPLFRNRASGSPFFAALWYYTPGQILRGAEDEGELGVYHSAYLQLRRAALALRLDEYIPVGFDNTLFDATLDPAYDLT
jgi:hypothetical protein